MARKKTKYVHIWDIVSLNLSSNMINTFRHGNGFSNIRLEEVVVLEPYSQMERANMATSSKSSSPYFYSYVLGGYDPFYVF